jgi:hypothetical protein
MKVNEWLVPRIAAVVVILALLFWKVLYDQTHPWLYFAASTSKDVP